VGGVTRAIALVDLDDTLFQTRRKCPADVEEVRLTPIGFDREGAALSFATPRQMSFLTWLAETTRLIPVTARSLDALRRVRLPFAAAICAHGGVILRDCGTSDPDWTSRMRDRSAACAATLAALAETIARAAGTEPVAVRVLAEDGIPLYVLAKHASADEAALARILAEAIPAPPAGWTVHLNGNNAAFLPPHLGKEKAVAALLPRLRSEHPDAIVIGIGDSLSDAPFMALCDFAMAPTGSQLAGRVFCER
jgi:hypothetical protein